MSVLIAYICFQEPYFVSKIFSFLFCRRFQNIGNEKPGMNSRLAFSGIIAIFGNSIERLRWGSRRKY